MLQTVATLVGRHTHHPPLRGACSQGPRDAGCLQSTVSSSVQIPSTRSYTTVMCLIQCTHFCPSVPQPPLVLTSLRNTRGGRRHVPAGLLGRSWRWREPEVLCPVRISVGVGLSSSNIVGSTATDSESPQASRGVFPGGLRRSEIRLPGLVLRVRADEVTEGDVSSLLDFLSTGVASGVTAVVLEAGADGPAGGAKLYEAARDLKALLRGRAQLLVSERVDIAAAAGADGVLLSDQGLPAAVARRMMQTSMPEVPVLPIVARSVSTRASALSATAGEGADLLILSSSEDGELTELVVALRDQVSIPIFVETLYTPASVSDSASAPSGLEVLKAGGNGVVLSATAACVSAEDVSIYFTSLLEALNLKIQQRVVIPSEDYSWYAAQVNGSNSEVESAVGTAVPVKETLDSLATEIMEEERHILNTMIDFVRDASSEMEEVSLLVDALAQLDELFLIVVVGEFNSGKSSVINALLGKKYLKEGVLPTTNEITLLRHNGDGKEAKERSERHPDGHFMQYLGAPLLKQMNLVDTPGTNVILQRQQRLTEEFVPRADLVLFVLSADRPFTESEVSFLRYIRQWGKKVVFILNKTDVFENLDELDEVTKFVAENAQRLLSIESAVVYPVSARLALKAKVAVGGEGVIDIELLSEDTDWKDSGFANLENFIMGFMGGATDAGAERIRLKLDTPLGIGVALLAACERQLCAEKSKVEADLQTLSGVEEQMQRYEEALQKTAVLQRQRTVALVEATKSRADQFIDAILRLTNVDVAAKYIIGTDRTQSLPVSVEFERRVLSSAYASVQVALEEHATWLQTNNERQLCSSIETVRSRWPDRSQGLSMSNGDDLVQSDKPRTPSEPNSSMGILKGFNTNAAMLLLEEEMREVVMGTFGGIGAAGLSASILTSVLPTTLEDLIALAVCSAGGLFGVVNLPGRREDVKKKVSQVADSLARQLEAAMQEDLQEALSKIREDVDKVVAPHRTAARQELGRIVSLEDRLEMLDKQLRSVRNRVQNLGS